MIEKARNLAREKFERLTSECDLVLEVFKSLQNASPDDKIAGLKALAGSVVKNCRKGKIVGLDFSNCSRRNFPYFMLFEFCRLINEVRDKTICVYLPADFRSCMAKARNTLIG